MPIFSDYISMYFIVHLVACAPQIRERSVKSIERENQIVRVEEINQSSTEWGKLDVSRIDCVLENRERKIESTKRFLLSMVGFTAHSFLLKCDSTLF